MHDAIVAGMTLFWAAAVIGAISWLPIALILSRLAGVFPLAGLAAHYILGMVLPFDSRGSELLLPGLLLLGVLILLIIPMRRPTAPEPGAKWLVSLPTYLMARGWPESRVLWTFMLIQIVLSLGAISIAAQHPS